MKGVIAQRAPGVTVVDVSHGVPPQDVTAGALVLRAAVPYFPAGTIHIAVVDPGVGSSRRAICVDTGSALLVGPDNGLLSLAAPRVRRIVELTDERFFLTPRSATFHGRDVFAPVAAALATGTDASALGAPLADPVRLSLPEPVTTGGRVSGQVIYVDGYGNLVTNVPPAAFPPGMLSISIAGVTVRGIQGSYAAVAAGEPVAVVDSWSLLEIAVRDGSAAARLGAGVGTPVTIETT